ncbi:MAG: hypothetical protein II887_07995 [Bacteroidales bacterium]|nr:hypothetical protein [Bacteroidales bacterium]
MIKRTIAIIVIAFLAIGPAIGQIILTEEDVGINQRLTNDPGSFNVMVPLQNSNLDQWKEGYVPIGNGLFLLVGLGGAYLLSKKKREKN